jgi:NADPH-dependent 2,4-dienoyl-CoA reductase/sulfur reductase-like enzyme
MSPEVRLGAIRLDKVMINHCAMPYALAKRTTLEEVIAPDTLVTRWDAKLFVDEARQIDPREKVVKCGNGSLKYKRLILAMGSDPIRPPIPGMNLDNILTLRHLDDIKKLDGLLDLPQTRNVVIVGGGYIGVEFAYVIKERANHNVTIIELLEHLLEASLDDEFCTVAEEELRRNGINLHTGSRVTEFKGKEKVERVLFDGKEIPADVVVLAIGVQPTVNLALNADIKGDRQGIEVNQYFRTSVEDIYAIGDVIKMVSPVTSDYFPGRLGSNAALEARILATNLFNGERAFPGVVNPAGTKVFDTSFGMVGLTERYARQRGIRYLTGRAKTTNIYKMLKGARPTEGKLIFREDDLTVIGAQFYGDVNIVGPVDLMGQAILRKFTLYDILGLIHTTQPELSPEPALNVLPKCAEDLWQRIK